jgi:hypothetical protein
MDLPVGYGIRSRFDFFSFLTFSAADQENASTYCSQVNI